MNNQRRLIGLLIAIIIPILATVFIINYSYNWKIYRESFRDEYVRRGDSSEESIDHYINFESYLYQETPFVKHQYKDEEGNVLFDFKVIRTLSDSDPKVVAYKFFLYNIDYERLIYLTKDNVKQNTPRVVDFKMTIAPGDEEPRTIRFQDSFLSDQDALPEYNYKAEKTFYKVKQITLNLGKDDFPKSGDLIIYQGDLRYDKDTNELKPDESEAKYTEFINIDIDNFTFDAEELDLDDFVSGLNNDVIKAGFGKYIFKTKIWWQAILTLLVTGIITFSFFFVWEYEQQANNQKQTKKKK